MEVYALHELQESGTFVLSKAGVLENVPLLSDVYVVAEDARRMYLGSYVPKMYEIWAMCKEPTECFAPFEYVLREKEIVAGSTSSVLQRCDVLISCR